MTTSRTLRCVAAFVAFGGCIQDPSLFVRLAGDGTGRVVSDPEGIDCGNTCGLIADLGVPIELTATPRSGSAMVGWKGGGCEDVDPMLPCVPELVQDTTITATFTLALRSLTITKSGSGGGNVTSSPLGISCGGDCQETYSVGTTLELTATPLPGNRFLGWIGKDECSSTTPCNLKLDTDASIGAIFEPL